MFANLVAYNNAGRGKISQGSVEYNTNDPDDVIQLTIGEYQYKFNNEGKLITTESNPQGVCMNNSNSKMTCAERPSMIRNGQPLQYTCVPTDFKTED
jgi:hypothetical protein